MANASRYARYPSLEGRSVLVTGGATGIGASIVEHFAAQGSRVAFLDRDEPAGAALVASLDGAAAHVPLFLPCDLTDVGALRLSVAAAEKALGPVRALVNNAASDDRHRWQDVTPAYWDERMAVNLRHLFFACQAVVPAMAAAGGGSIVNLSSIAWVIPSTGLPAYVTAKAGIVGLTRTLAHELGRDAIRVNCVMPGAIATERQKRLWLTPAYTAEIQSRQALKRELVPADVARLVLFLAADDSESVTNQSYVVDGGWV
jgi:NAD(P)-dependent dehydrogenase (short-subunit alcohol dehydrogenase family)